MKHIISKLGTYLGILHTTGGYQAFHREDDNNSQLLILVHGFTGRYRSTWGSFPNLITNDLELSHYDVLLWGYPTDILKRSPEISQIGERLKTELDHLPERYQHIVIAAHSMGGLVVRATVVAALTQGKRTDITKLKHIVLFGTPNEGIDKADRVPRDVKKQIDDMKTTSDFIIDLRNQWLDRVYRADKFDDQYHLAIPTTAVAGLEDRFVPPGSVSAFFAECKTTDGDHRGMVKPRDTSHSSFRILHKILLKPAPHYDNALKEQDAALVEKTVSLLSQQLEFKDDQLASRDQQFLELTKAVTALSKARDEQDAPAGIDEALVSLSQGKTMQAESLFQSIANSGERDAQKTAEAYRHLGALAFLHDTQKALNAYRRSTELDPTNTGSWNNLGLLLDRTGDLDGAITAYERLFELSHPEDQVTAWACGNLGNVYKTRGELDRAEKFYLKSLQINDALHCKAGMADDYGNLGIVYITRGKLDRAEKFYLKSLQINKTLDRKEGMANQYGNLGNVYITRGDLEKAEELHLKSLRINETLDRKEGMANQYGNLGVVYEKRGDLEKAEEFHLKSLQINKTLDRKEGMANQYGNLGNVYITRGDLEKAEELHLKSLRINETLDRKEGMANQYGNLGVVYEKRGDLDKARTSWEQSLSLFKELGAQPMVQLVKSLLEALPEDR